MSVLLSGSYGPRLGRTGNLSALYLISPTCAKLTHAMASRWRADLESGLVERGVAVVSGGAYGIDGAAHRAALAAEGVTVAVMAGGYVARITVPSRQLFIAPAPEGFHQMVLAAQAFQIACHRQSAGFRT